MYNSDFEEMRAFAHKFAKDRELGFLNAWCKEANLKEPIAYKYVYGSGFVIYTNRPGLLIGKGGELVNKYRNILRETFHKEDDIKFVDIFGGGFANVQ